MLENSNNSYRYFTRSGLRVQTVCSLQEQPLHICASSTSCTLAKEELEVLDVQSSFPIIILCSASLSPTSKRQPWPASQDVKEQIYCWPLEASPPSFFWQAGRQVGRCSPPRTSLPGWIEPAHRRQVAATEPPHATSNSAFPSRLSCEQPLKPVGNNELAARGLQVDSD